MSGNTKRRWAVVATTLLAGCSGGGGGVVAVVRIDEGLELADAQRQVAERYYAEHPDDRDQLVVWDSSSRFFTHVSYLAVANDVAGIGYRHVGLEQEVFDLGADYASARLQGLIWFGSRWRVIDDDGAPDSALGTLISETLHRWGAMVHHDGGAGDSDELLSTDRLHWSGLVDAGDSPLGGYRWQDAGGGTFTRAPLAANAASDLDLYLMGLLPAAEVAPVRLLTEVSFGVCSQPESCSEGWRDVPPETVTATPIEIGVDQVIAAEGARAPASSPRELRQGWIYVVHGEDEIDSADVDRLEALAARWEAFYAEVTRDLGAVVTGR